MKYSKLFLIILGLGFFVAALATYTGRSIKPGPTGASVSSADDMEDKRQPALRQNITSQTSEHIQKATEMLIEDLRLLEQWQEEEEKSRIIAANGELFARGSEISMALADGSGSSPESGGFECDDTILQGTVDKGETLSEVLERATAGSIGHYVQAAGKIFSFRAFREGQPYVIVTDGESGKVKRFEYEINESRRLVVEGEAKPRARLEPIEYSTHLATASGTINDNLFQTVAEIGENPQLAFRLVNLFGSEINFIRDVRPGASFSVLLEKRFRNGKYKGYGRILAARFINGGKTWEAFLFRDATGKAAYYNRKGENLHKTLLQSPLAVTRLTSRFSQSRKHPILGFSRPHLGVDYGAPTGTPVKAVGEGIVTKRGWGGGYGNQIILKHSGGLESLYAHLSGFARGLKEGQKVSQGQVIGFVGSTGLSTGPHLDFRLRQNGKFVDPTKAINPRSLPVSQKLMSEFKKVREVELACLDGTRKIENYTVDSIVSLPVLFTEDKVTGKRITKVARKTGRRAPQPARAKKRAGKRR